KMGVDVQPVSGGCCGLAGSWGFEQGKYQLSLDCGEQALLPAIRDNPGAVVVANGFSCQTQISDAGAATPLHLAQVLAMANQSGRSSVPPGRPQAAPGVRAARVGVPLAAMAAAAAIASRALAAALRRH
ncbi:MAG: FAD-binding oxidoreductase, partial [Mycobacterium sp.]